MAFTKVVGPGIHTQSQLRTHNIHSSGIITASSFVGPLTASSGSSGTFDSLTITGNVSIGGTLQYEDVTNVESVGIITAKEGIFLPDSKELKLGNTAASPDLKIYHDPSTTPDTNRITAGSSQILELQTDKLRIVDVGATVDLIAADDGGSVDLFHAGNKKLETTSTGAVVTGILTATDFSGATGGAADFPNGLTGTTGTFTGDITIPDKIIHAGDVDTLIRFPGADEIQFDTGGTEYLKLHRYASVNFVEAGSTAHLSLADNGTNIRGILIGDGNASSTGGLRLQAGGGSSGFGGGIVMYSHANADNPGGVYIGKSVGATGSIIFGNSGTGNVSAANEFVRITSAGKVGIGSTIPTNALDVQAGTTNTAIVARSTDSKAQISLLDNSTTSVGSVVIGAEGDELFLTSGSGGGEGLRIDSNGKILAGTISSRNVAGGAAKLQIEAASSEGMSLTRTTDDNGAIYFSFGKVRTGGANGGRCIAGDNIGSISWNPSDGTDLNHASAEIYTEVATGIVGNDVPGDLIFKTNGGTTTTTERLRITSDGWLKYTGTRTGDETNKLGRFLMPSHDTNEEDVMYFQMQQEGSFNQLELGGGSSSYNAATKLIFRTAAIDTVTGANRLEIDSSGQSTFDKGAPNSADQVIARFQCESSRKLDIVWHDTGSKMGFNTPGNHDYTFKCNDNERLTIDASSAHIQVNGTFQVNNFQVRDAGFTGTWNTGISVNAGNAGACMIFMCCRNWDANDNTHAGVYLVRLGYSGGQNPGVTYINGNNSWTIDRNTTDDTVQINGGSGNQRVTILWTT